MTLKTPYHLIFNRYSLILRTAFATNLNLRESECLCKLVKLYKDKVNIS